MRKGRYKSLSRITPVGGKRGCLCKDHKTYHPDCCTGEMHAQGVGKIHKIWPKIKVQLYIIYNP